jgi:hypothetical protein
MAFWGMEATETEVMIWMIKNQLGRRNLAPNQKLGRYATKLIELESIVAKERQGHRTDLDDDTNIPANWQESKKGEVSEIVANDLHESTLPALYSSSSAKSLSTISAKLSSYLPCVFRKITVFFESRTVVMPDSFTIVSFHAQCIYL